MVDEARAAIERDRAVAPLDLEEQAPYAEPAGLGLEQRQHAAAEALAANLRHEVELVDAALAAARLDAEAPRQHDVADRLPAVSDQPATAEGDVARDQPSERRRLALLVKLMAILDV